jgi:hypothetical protein
MIQFARSLPANPNAFWPDANEESPLKPRQTSWQASDRFAPGTWYVHVASVTPAPPCPPDADACPDDVTEWSPAIRFTVPPTPGIVPGKGIDFATLGMKTDDVRAALGPPPSLEGTPRAPVYEYYGGALRILFARGRVTRFEVISGRYKVEGTTVRVGSNGAALRAGVKGRALSDVANAVAVPLEAHAPPLLLPRVASEGRGDDLLRDQGRPHLEREARPSHLRQVRPLLRAHPLEPLAPSVTRPGSTAIR